MNIDEIKGRIESACGRCGRNPGEITLMAVTKTKSRELADIAYNAGIRVFGENRVQEAEGKYAEFFPDAELHLIGHLQSNKAKNAASLFSWVQSIDKYKTAEALARHSESNNKVMNILLEVNTSGEDTKFGYRSDECMYQDIDRILTLEPLKLRGIMTIGPFTSNESEIRHAFITLKEKFDMFHNRFPELQIDTLSMGMSGDYEIAIEEGATLLRVGTTIFGARS